jgi:hypothetical protein
MTPRHTLSDAYRALRQREAEKQASVHAELVKAIGKPELQAKVEKINQRRVGNGAQ